MKTHRLTLGAALALGLVSSQARAGLTTPPDPALSVTTSISDLSDGLFQVETLSFSGSDFCGDAYHAFLSPAPGPNPVDVTCGDTVFIGLWEPGPSGNGEWFESVTLQSSPGGTSVELSNVGLISGSMGVLCGNANLVLYAYDLNQGTLITSVSVPSFRCFGHIIVGESASGAP
jgi:hypothetical protein